MKHLTRAQRANLVANILYPDNADRLLTLREVADWTNRDIRVIRHFVKKGTLPAEKNEKGEYLVKVGHLAIVLVQPAWGERSKLNRQLTQTVVPGTTPEATLG